MVRARMPQLWRSVSSITPSSTIKPNFGAIEAELKTSSPNWSIVEDFLSKKLSKGLLSQFQIVENRVKNHSFERIPPRVFQLLILGCYKEKRIADAVDLYLKVCSLYLTPSFVTSSVEKSVDIDKFNHERMINYLLKVIAHSKDFTDLLELKILWENYIYLNTKTSNAELLYFACFINVALNTGQIEVAVDKLKLSYNALLMDDNTSKKTILLAFPMLRILDLLAADGNCDEIYEILQMIEGDKARTNDNDNNNDVNNNSNEINIKDVVPLDHWFVYLSAALSKNHYPLVKFIYSTVIMRGYDEGEITTENALFSQLELGATESALSSLTDEIILQILHTLSLNGDVQLTLSLIQSHFIHKKLKGERALTRELCVCIVKAYCFNEELQDSWPESSLDSQIPVDHSVERVLDVLDGFIRKLEKEGKDTISYKDISDSMSFKFKNFKVLDSKIEAKKMSKVNEANDKRPVKNTNPNIESSAQGNVLSNLDTLTSFVIDHIEYLQDNQASVHTIRLFINCLLNHVSLYQNLSGVVRVLTNLHKQNSALLEEWLDADLMDIILNATSKSSAGKFTSYELFKYLRKRQNLLASQQYIWLTNSILRDDFHECLQFYIFNYLKDCKVVDIDMLRLLRDIPPAAINMNDKTRALMGFLERNLNKLVEPEEVDEFWRVTELRATFPEHISGKSMPELGRKYHKYIDIRDVEYIKYIFG